MKLLKNPKISRPRWYRKDFPQGLKDQFLNLVKGNSVYVGNLSFYTSDLQIDSFFSRAGRVKRVIMGIHRVQKTPCGFCFVEFQTHEEAMVASLTLNGARLDGRTLKVEIDFGFKEGRQYGRGIAGGQVRDEFRDNYDKDRGGFGDIVKKGMKSAVHFHYKATSTEGESASLGSGSPNTGTNAKRTRDSMDSALPTGRAKKMKREIGDGDAADGA